MDQIIVDGVPLGTYLEAVNSSETEKKQKFVTVCGNQELHFTACAVSRLSGIHNLPNVEGYKSYFVEPNQKWLEDSNHERAWVKVYRKLNPETDSKIEDRIQTLKITMPFLGESHKECWGEIQFFVKKQVTKNGNLINLKSVRISRHRCFDTRVGKWIQEAKLIEPKNNPDSPDRSHYYISLRFYHQSHLPPVPGDWHFEPVYAAVAGEDFYRVDAVWKDEEITITATSIDKSSSEIPELLR